MHALAERLGYTVGELGERLTMAELRDWIAFDRLRGPKHQSAPNLENMRAAFGPVKSQENRQ